MGMRIFGCFEEYHTNARLIYMIRGEGGSLYVHEAGILNLLYIDFYSI
jgi:hypothetical protein